MASSLFQAVPVCLVSTLAIKQCGQLFAEEDVCATNVISRTADTETQQPWEKRRALLTTPLTAEEELLCVINLKKEYTCHLEFYFAGSGCCKQQYD